MKNIFSVVPQNFFNPLTGKSKDVICDCILRIFNTYKKQISYGIDKNYILNELQAYFETNNTEITFDDEEILVSDARSKANEIVRVLKNTGG